jgi:hypothetical protein
MQKSLLSNLMPQLPPYISREDVSKRLPLIFPEGTPNRNYCIRELAASTIFTMLYMGAVEDNSIYMSPLHVYRMTKEQSTLSEEKDRYAYNNASSKKGFQPEGKRWYADNTREPIRDETLREGLLQVGAVKQLTDITTTSSKPRYYLQKEFSQLFDPELKDGELTSAIQKWQDNNLTKGALVRVKIAGRSAKSSGDKVSIKFPDGEVKNISPGPSSDISKAVIEVFADSFLKEPVVLWLSTSDTKVADNQMASSIGLKIDPSQDLPDIILADLGEKEPMLVFVEVVATDGAITERRQQAIFEITGSADFKSDQIAFVTAYADRQSPGFKKTIPHLAWNSFAWFVSEPDKIVIFKDGLIKIADMLF